MTTNTTSENIDLMEEGEDMKDTRVILDKLKEMDNRIEKLSDKFDAKMEKIDDRLEKIDDRLDKMDDRMDRMDARMDKIDAGMDKMSDEMHSGFSRLDGRIDTVNDKIDRLDESVHSIKLELENETRKNIQVIAEGHLDLVRNLDTIMKNQYEDQQDRELIKLRSNYLDSEIKKIRDHVHMPA